MSLTHPFSILVLEDASADGTPGQIIFTPRPGTKGIDVTTSLKQLAAAGAQAILTLMPLEEMQRNDVADLSQQCKSLGLLWFHLPIEDDHAPENDFQNAWATAKRAIHELLDAGKTLAIHCKGGSGRTGLVAAQILLERGMPLEQVIDKVRAIRPNALQLPVHQSYINQTAQDVDSCC